MKLDMVATVTYAAPRINGTPPVRPRLWYSETMYTVSLVSGCSTQASNGVTYRISLELRWIVQHTG
jgi:hypothetical protein